MEEVMKKADERPPHFPDPNANAIALLEAALAEKDEALADAYKEAKAWQAQLETALAWNDALWNELLAMRSAQESANVDI